MVEFFAGWTTLRDYKRSCARFEELLAARKVLRNFIAFEGGEGEYKSSLDGAREHVIQKRSNRLFESNLKSNEYLDAIGIVKRFGGGRPRFDSTVDVAAGPFVQGIKKSPNGEEAFWCITRVLQDQRILSGSYTLLHAH